MMPQLHKTSPKVSLCQLKTSLAFTRFLLKKASHNRKITFLINVGLTALVLMLTHYNGLGPIIIIYAWTDTHTFIITFAVQSLSIHNTILTTCYYMHSSDNSSSKHYKKVCLHSCYVPHSVNAHVFVYSYHAEINQCYGDMCAGLQNHQVENFFMN